MANINVETKGPKGPQIKESLLPAAVTGYMRGLAVVYGTDAYHATLVAGAGGAIAGLIEEDAVSTQNPVAVIEQGQAVAQIGAPVTAGAELAVNAAAQLVPAGPGQAVVAIALEANPNAGDYIAVLVIPGGALAAGNAVAHYVAAGAIPVTTGVAGLGSAGALAMTLAAPTNAQDGTRILITAETAHAHTVTTPANAINGAKHIATFAAQGDGVELVALGGVWNVSALVGGTVLS